MATCSRCGDWIDSCDGDICPSCRKKLVKKYEEHLANPTITECKVYSFQEIVVKIVCDGVAYIHPMNDAKKVQGLIDKGKCSVETFSMDDPREFSNHFPSLLKQTGVRFHHLESKS